MMLQTPFGAEAAAAASETVPSYVEIPNAGEYKMGGDNRAVEKDGKMQTGTEFYLRIENPKSQKYYGGGDSSDSGGSSTATVRGITYTNFPMGIDQELYQIPGPGGLSGNLPKTGDYGPDKMVLCELALLFGAGYLLCDRYEKKQEQCRCEKDDRSAL